VPSKTYGILAAGRPAVYVGAADGDLARLVTERDCGIAVAVGDSAGLAAALTLLRDSPSRLQSMGLKARELALSRYTSEHAVADWLEFLEEIAPSTVSSTPRMLNHARYT
jgi:colanic acid biosynthesis glycosyl transferase WcaI